MHNNGCVNAYDGDNAYDAYAYDACDGDNHSRKTTYRHTHDVAKAPLNTSLLCDTANGLHSLDSTASAGAVDASYIQ